MAKDPAFLFYPNDYIGGTMGMDFEQKGAYIELLMLQFNRGHMSEHMILHVLLDNSDLWDAIKYKFKIDKENKYYNERLELEKEKRAKYSLSRKNNRNSTKDKPLVNSHKKDMSSHMSSHMENEDVNEDVNNIKQGNEKIHVSKIIEAYGYIQNVSGTKEIWDKLPIETQKTIIEHAKTYRKHHESKGKIKFLPDLYKYLSEERYLAPGLPYSDEPDVDPKKDKSDWKMWPDGIARPPDIKLDAKTGMYYHEATMQPYLIMPKNPYK